MPYIFRHTARELIPLHMGGEGGGAACELIESRPLGLRGRDWKASFIIIGTFQIDSHEPHRQWSIGDQSFLSALFSEK